MSDYPRVNDRYCLNNGIQVMGEPNYFWSTWYQSKSFWSRAEKKIFANSRPAANGPSSHTMSACSPSPWPAKCNDWLVERKKNTLRFWNLMFPQSIPPCSCYLYKPGKKKHLPVPRTVRNAHVLTGNLGLSDIEEVILTLSIFLHSLEGLQKPQRSFPPKSLQIT